MNPIMSYLLEIALTLAVCLMVTAYLRPYLKRVLLDLCGTEERAQFWTAFSNMLLIGLPMILALTYQPKAKNTEELFFEIVRKLSGNLGAYLFALVGAGIMIAFFALIAPRAPKTETK
jgi:hypothetical protein